MIKNGPKRNQTKCNKHDTVYHGVAQAHTAKEPATPCKRSRVSKPFHLQANQNLLDLRVHPTVISIIFGHHQKQFKSVDNQKTAVPLTNIEKWGEIPPLIPTFKAGRILNNKQHSKSERLIRPLMSFNLSHNCWTLWNSSRGLSMPWRHTEYCFSDLTLTRWFKPCRDSRAGHCEFLSGHH